MPKAQLSVRIPFLPKRRGYPRLPNGKRKKFNVYAETRDQCEVKLTEMIAEKKAEIAEKKAKLKEGAK